MNKQALAFLTMFSLVLMLSVYYVTLPDDSTKTVMKDESGKTIKSDNAKKKTVKEDNTSKKQDKKTTNSNAVSKLQDNINQKKEVEINKNNDIVANASSDDGTKEEALTKIDRLKEQTALQKNVVDALTKKGFKTAVEINDTTCIVNVFEHKDDKETAKKILVATNEIINSKYLIEVTFK